MNIENITKYAVFGEGDMCAVKNGADNIQRYVKLEDVVELLEKWHNKQSTSCQYSCGSYCSLTGNKI